MNHHVYPGGFTPVTYPGLEAIAGHCIDPMIRELETMVDSDLPETSFLFPNMERDVPATQVYIDMLATMFDDTGTPTEELRRAVTLPFHFAHAMGAVMLNRTAGMCVDVLPIGPGMGYLDARDKLGETVSAFLSDSPNLDGLIGAYSPELETSQKYGYVAELVAASTFLAIDEAERRRTAQEAQLTFDDIVARLLSAEG